MYAITSERIEEALSYDEGTGLFNWKIRPSGRAKIGDVAGVISFHGYRVITLDGIKMRGNRLAWFMKTGSWPKSQIDHIDGNRANDAFANLREATQSQNAANGKLRKTNTSGLKGVSWDREKQKWVAGIRKNYKRIVLGRFDDKHEAHKAYLIAAEKLFGQYARAA